MLTKEGSIRTQNISVGPALWQYRKKLQIVSLIALILGAVGLVMYIIGSAIEAGDGKGFSWIDISLVCAIPFTLGLIAYITVIRLKKREKDEDKTSECTFYADCFFYNSKATQGSATVEKICYADAVLKKENEEYGYVFVSGRGLFLVFSKQGLQEAELNAIRKKFNKAIPDGEEIAELKDYPNTEENK